MRISDWSSDVCSSDLFEKGDPTAWTYPEIAPAFANTYFAISANAPHPKAARLFTAWFFTPEGASVMHEVQARPTLKGVPDNRTAVAKLKQTDWWRPYPEDIRWIPEREDWGIGRAPGRERVWQYV